MLSFLPNAQECDATTAWLCTNADLIKNKNTFPLQRNPKSKILNLKSKMDAIIQAKIDAWLNGNFDEQTKTEIMRLQKENPDQLADAFYKNLEFGTGGLRGIMGVGTNRMNKYTVGMATQGYLNYLKQCFGDNISVAIGHDSRNNSRSFAEITANVFAAN